MCNHCSTGMTGSNVTHMKTHLLNPSICSFLASPQAALINDPEVRSLRPAGPVGSTSAGACPTNKPNNNRVCYVAGHSATAGARCTHGQCRGVGLHYVCWDHDKLTICTETAFICMRVRHFNIFLFWGVLIIFVLLGIMRGSFE